MDPIFIPVSVQSTTAVWCCWWSEPSRPSGHFAPLPARWFTQETFLLYKKYRLSNAIVHSGRHCTTSRHLADVYEWHTECILTHILGNACALSGEKSHPPHNEGTAGLHPNLWAVKREMQESVVLRRKRNQPPPILGRISRKSAPISRIWSQCQNFEEGWKPPLLSCLAPCTER